MLRRRVDHDDQAVLYPDSLRRELATFHLPGYLHDNLTDYARTLCGFRYVDTTHLPIRHAVRFARPCRRCLAIAGWLDISEATPSPGVTVTMETP